MKINVDIRDLLTDQFAVQYVSQKKFIDNYSDMSIYDLFFVYRYQQ